MIVDDYSAGEVERKETEGDNKRDSLENSAEKMERNRKRGHPSKLDCPPLTLK